MYDDVVVLLCVDCCWVWCVGCVWGVGVGVCEVVYGVDFERLWCVVFVVVCDGEVVVV